MNYEQTVKQWLDDNNARYLRADYDKESKTSYQYFAISGRLIMLVSKPPTRDDSYDAWFEVFIPVGPNSNVIADAMQGLKDYVSN